MPPPRTGPTEQQQSTHGHPLTQKCEGQTIPRGSAEHSSGLKELLLHMNTNHHPPSLSNDDDGATVSLSVSPLNPRRTAPLDEPTDNDDDDDDNNDNDDDDEDDVNSDDDDNIDDDDAKEPEERKQREQRKEEKTMTTTSKEQRPRCNKHH